MGPAAPEAFLKDDVRVHPELDGLGCLGDLVRRTLSLPVLCAAHPACVHCFRKESSVRAQQLCIMHLHVMPQGVLVARDVLCTDAPACCSSTATQCLHGCLWSQPVCTYTFVRLCEAICQGV